MSVRKRFGLVAILVVLLVGVGIWASAQSPQQRPPTRADGDSLSLIAPTVIAGNDLGFRIESERDNIPTGKLVVRINGRWVEAQIGTSGVVPLGGR